MSPRGCTPLVVLLAVSPCAQAQYVRTDGTAGAIRYASQFTGSDAALRINAAIADLPSTGGVVDARGFEGEQAFSVTVLLNKPVLLLLGSASFSGSVDPLVKVEQSSQVIGVGASTAVGANTGPTSASERGTILRTTGSNRAVLIVGGLGAPPSGASHVADLSIDNASSASGTVGIDIDKATDVRIERVSIYPNKKFANAGIRLGETGPVVDILLRDVLVRANQVGLQAKDVSGHLVVSHSRMIQNDTAAELGSDSTNVVSFHAYGSTFEAASDTSSSVRVKRVFNASFSDCYFENGGSGYAIDIPTSAVLAWNVSVRGSFFVGNLGGTKASYAINVDLPVATLSVYDSFFGDYASGSRLVRNPQAARVLLIGNDLDSSGVAGLFTNAGNVTAFSNRIAALGGNLVENVVDGGLQLQTTVTQPSCTVTRRGLFWVAQNGTGVKDSVQVCAKDSSDGYAWRTLYQLRARQSITFTNSWKCW